MSETYPSETEELAGKSRWPLSWISSTSFSSLRPSMLYGRGDHWRERARTQKDKARMTTMASTPVLKLLICNVLPSRSVFRSLCEDKSLGRLALWEGTGISKKSI